jgi:hypothetical protein
MDTPEELRVLLVQILKQKQERSRLVKEFQRRIWTTAEGSRIGNEIEDGLLRDLAYDLDYYEPDSKTRPSDYSYYDDDHLEHIVGSVLELLK